ncbi:MAG: lipoyl(octanoyl) transferase LipB [Alphaproteobacteria bacterium]
MQASISDSDKLIQWRAADQLVEYPAALEKMETIVEAIQAGSLPNQGWLLEHPPIYTVGTSGNEEDILQESAIPRYQTGRGGQVTYHGPGQRICYLMLNLKHFKQDVRWYIRTLEQIIIDLLASYGITGHRQEDAVGVWVENDRGSFDKVAAIGVRVRKWVTFHGFALNVDPDLDDYLNIVPCGIRDRGVTSLAKLGVNTTMAAIDEQIKTRVNQHFGTPH